MSPETIPPGWAARQMVISSGDIVAYLDLRCLTSPTTTLGNIASWLKRPLRWDPDAQHFVNDAEANRMTARAMRGPWQV